MFVALENAVHYQVEGHEVLSLDSLLKGVMKSQGRLGKAPCEVREFYLMIEIPSRQVFRLPRSAAPSERAFSSTTDTVPKCEIDLVASTLNKSQCVAIETGLL